VSVDSKSIPKIQPVDSLAATQASQRIVRMPL
jgi:hypothetical protein